VFYHFDVADPAKRGVETKPTTPNIGKGFNQACQIDDIVSVNGKPAEGLHMTCPCRMGFNPAPAPGFGVADSAAAGPHIGCYWELPSKDGKFVGRFVDGGFFPHSVFGGAGAFFGASGKHHFVSVRPERAASVAEDPSLRRAFGRGSYRVQYHFVPMFYPQIETGSEGPADFHADDSSPVTAARPARAGELQVARAKNLGPTTPLVRPGQPFPECPESAPPEVNSDVEVTVNGKAADVLYKIGWSGESSVYRVDFRVPAGTAAGMAAVQLTAAWIPSEEVKIPVRSATHTRGVGAPAYRGGTNADAWPNVG